MFGHYTSFFPFSLFFSILIVSANYIVNFSREKIKKSENIPKKSIKRRFSAEKTDLQSISISKTESA